MTHEVKYFGDFVQPDENVREYLLISFSSRTLDVNDLWENSALSAKFLSSLWGKFFPATGKERKTRRAIVEDSVRFIAAELLGNAVKFGFGKEFDIRMNLHMEKSELRFFVTNRVDSQSIYEFQTFIQRLLSEDLNEMYLGQMERNAQKGNPESRMGYLTMLLDYDAKLSWEFIHHEDLDIVTTLARLPVIRCD